MHAQHVCDHIADRSISPLNDPSNVPRCLRGENSARIACPTAKSPPMPKPISTRSATVRKAMHVELRKSCHGDDGQSSPAKFSAKAELVRQPAEHEAAGEKRPSSAELPIMPIQRRRRSASDDSSRRARSRWCRARILGEVRAERESPSILTERRSAARRRWKRRNPRRRRSGERRREAERTCLDILIIHLVSCDCSERRMPRNDIPPDGLNDQRPGAAHHPVLRLGGASSSPYFDPSRPGARFASRRQTARLRWTQSLR